MMEEQLSEEEEEGECGGEGVRRGWGGGGGQQPGSGDVFTQDKNFHCLIINCNDDDAILWEVSVWDS